MSDNLDWYVTDDFESPLDKCQWTYIVHVSRLGMSEVAT